MMAGFETLLTLAQTYGLFEFYLPFLLVFSLFYGLLEKTKIFGTEGKRVNVIIALVSSLYILIFSPVSITISTFFSTFFAETSLVIVTLLVGMMMVGLLAGDIFNPSGWKNIWSKSLGIIVFLGFLLGVGIFWTSGGFQLFGQIAPGISVSAEDMMLIVLIAFTVVIMWYMSRGEGGGGKE